MKMESQIRLVNIEQIIPNRFQPRLTFSQAALMELSSSIRSHGIIQPLTVRRIGDKYEIIAGERRYKAAQLAGLTQVPVIITDLNDNDSAEVAIIENTHRKDMTPIEEAKSYKKLLDRKYVTQEQLAARLGISQSAIANKLRLLNLDPAVQDALSNEKISERHARSLLKLTDKFRQVELLNRTISERWPVKKLDDEIASIIGEYSSNKADLVGGINVNRNDIDVEKVMEETSNIDNPKDFNEYKYGAYKPNNNVFLNDLESSSVNMNGGVNFGVNPFSGAGIHKKIDEDIDLLELDDDEDVSSDQVSKDDKKEEEKGIEKVTYNTTDDVMRGIKDMVANANENGVEVLKEEFAFDDMYQFVIRIPRVKHTNNQDQK